MRHLQAAAGELAVPESVKDLLLRRLRAAGRARAARARGRGGARARVRPRRARAGDWTPTATSCSRRSTKRLAERVLVEVPDAIGRFAFAHALIRETIYEQLSATRRARLHLRAGEALEELHADRLDEHAAALAHHFGQAGDDAQELRVPAARGARARRACTRSRRRSSHYERRARGRARLGLSPDDDERMRALPSSADGCGR